MDQEYRQRNDASRQRLRDLVAGLDTAAMQRMINGDWSVGAALAHLAFWDYCALARWNEYDRTGGFTGLSREVVELINEASLPAWRVVGGTAAGEMALTAAELADARVADLSDAELAYVRDNGREFILDRASHRNAHLDQIEQALAR